MNKQIIAIAAAATLSVPALAADKAPAAANEAPRAIPVYLLHETYIPFGYRDGIQDFEPMSDRVVFLQARDRQWYRAKTIAPCFGLDRAVNMGFESNSDGTFDRFSSIYVDGRRCQLESLAQSEQPWTRKDITKD